MSRSHIKQPQAKYIRSTFWRYSLPAITAMLVNGLYQVVDGIFIGKVIGYSGLAAINMAWPIIFFLVGFGIMVGIGAGSLLSIHQGESELNQASQSKSNFSAKLLITSFYVMLALGLASSFALSLFGERLLVLQSGTPEGIILAKAYLDWFSIGGVLSILAAALPLLIRNDNSPMIATALMGLGALLNIVFDYLFIDYFNLGLAGAAMATLIAQCIVCLLGLCYFFSRYSTKPFQLASESKIKTQSKSKDFSLIFDVSLAKKIIALGASSLIIYLYTSVMVGLHNALFMEYGNALTVGAYAIVGYLMVLYYFVAEGIADGSQPPISYFFGGKRQSDIQALVMLSIKVTLVAGLGWTLLLNLFPHELIQLFNHDDQALTQATIQGIQLHLFALALDGFIMLASIYFTSVNQAAKALSIALANMFIQLPFLYILPKWLGLEGVWLAMPISNIVLFMIVAPMLYLDLRKPPHVSKIQPSSA